MFTDVDGIVSDTGRVYHTDNAETVHLQGVWGELEWVGSGWAIVGEWGVLLGVDLLGVDGIISDAVVV